MTVLSRRRVLATGAAALAGPAQAAAPLRFTAFAFDAFPVLDPRPVAALAETLFPGRGAALMDLWRARQFDYAWLRTLSGTYKDFAAVTADALSFAARTLGLALSDAARMQLMAPWTALKAWDDAAPALRDLKAHGARLAFLSNFSPAMLAGSIRAAGLDGVFDHVLSTDAARRYKPDPAAYRLGVEAFKRATSEILFVAFAGWDVAGARAFGYPTFWVNRAGAGLEELGETPDGVGRTLDDLVRFVS